eukprot:gnl/TRDRNA2_/TRDRNA2_83713_c1_seq1.p1 gnl/TRDRNA2_/TRDRNA2_83713_c1~~gnl/TRDRNA2_/TRDRNA2_83713_c1_seq1.p1  ORF type:complete len:294 (-),score=54.28 gnl/TRDRNA2_/TRDRNA2_83713_c1_seq1:42-824(-)
MEAEDEDHKCCNTCEDVKAAYRDKNITEYYFLDDAPQCQSSVGCRVTGDVEVNKVSGNIHVSLGRSVVRGGKHVKEFSLHELTDAFNTSHEIHSITFGQHVPGVNLGRNGPVKDSSFDYLVSSSSRDVAKVSSLLDGSSKTVHHGVYMFHYYIKLVPTAYVSRNGDVVYTHQYSLTDASKNVKTRNGELSGIPGVFIVYDFTPFLMRKVEKAKPWNYIFIHICAIIGGVFSIAMLVEMIVYNVMRWCGCTFDSCVAASVS